MSAALQQGRTLNFAVEPKKNNDNIDLESFNKSVSAYSVSHKEYVSALLEGNTDQATLTSLEQTANANYAKVISDGSAVSKNTSRLISDDDDASYGARLRDLRKELDSVVYTLSEEQRKLNSYTTSNNTGEVATQDFKTQAIAEQNRYVLWMIASVIVIMLIAAYLS